MGTTLKLAKDLNNISLEELVSSLRIHEIELEEDEPQKRGKSVVLKSKPEKAKAYQANEESKGSDEDIEDDDELSLISKRVNRLWKHRKWSRKVQRSQKDCWSLRFFVRTEEARFWKRSYLLRVQGARPLQK